jgi:hypothetical protein
VFNISVFTTLVGRLDPTISRLDTTHSQMAKLCSLVVDGETGSLAGTSNSQTSKQASVSCGLQATTAASGNFASVSSNF